MNKRNKMQNELKLKMQKVWSIMTDEEKFNLILLEVEKNKNTNLMKILMNRYAVYIDNNTDIDERCKYCKYDICSEHDDCIDGIFEKIMDELE